MKVKYSQIREEFLKFEKMSYLSSYKGLASPKSKATFALRDYFSSLGTNRFNDRAHSQSIVYNDRLITQSTLTAKSKCF